MTVIQRGTDTSGRPLKLTRPMWDALDAVFDDLGFKPTIVKGGFLPGDDLSATTHMGDAFDLRLRDRGPAERAAIIKAMNAQGIAYWERYPSQGFDLHGHGVPGAWASPSPSALRQWESLIDGHDGLARNGPDYHDRSNFVTTPPKKEDDMTPEQDARLKRVEDALAELAASVLAGRRAANIRLDSVRKNVVKAVLEGREQGKDVDAIQADVDKLLAEVDK